MGRLTKKFDDGYGSTDCYHSCFDCYGNECDSVTLMVNKLAHYEDLEEQGRLVELPCAVGKTAYFAEDNGRIVPRKIIRPELLSQGEDFYRNGKLYKGNYYSCSIDYANDHIGQTEEEAREKMAWLKLEGVKE